MKIIPYEKYSLKSNLTVEEAISKLKANTEPNELFGSGTKIFHGNIYNDTFDICRIISYQNSFLPKIKGNIRSEANSIIIDIKMHLHPFVIVFMFIWFSGLLLEFIVSTIALMNNLSDFLRELLIFFGMLTFSIGLCTIPFWIEVKKAKQELEKILIME
ncbi:hypothetical protein [Leptospira kirschneri]|uniref:hypothetical protein n=1 Tax=Leptospira kirschneri TaxID=29507 RepID=UPI00031FD863|nr:hypothetical protein [Leptospira kirschneri]